MILLIFTVSSVATLPAARSVVRGLKTQAASLGVNPFVRRYREGEKITYRMKATNRDPQRTISYELLATGTVKKDSAGRFFEEYEWSDLVVNGRAIKLPPGSESFRQDLSLAPDYTLSIPDLSQVHPNLIGPITDLLTIYADVKLVMQQNELVHPGDHVYVKYGKPNSWADGARVILGEDVIDFDFSFKDLNAFGRTAVVTVRHVPPQHHELKFPAEWMRTPVADDTANNWVQVSKEGGEYNASVGKETFNVEIKIDLADGKVLTAAMDNPVEMAERRCADAALTGCTAPVRYQIRRQVEIELEN